MKFKCSTVCYTLSGQWERWYGGFSFKVELSEENDGVCASIYCSRTCTLVERYRKFDDLSRETAEEALNKFLATKKCSEREAWRERREEMQV